MITDALGCPRWREDGSDLSSVMVSVKYTYLNMYILRVLGKWDAIYNDTYSQCIQRNYFIWQIASQFLQFCVTAGSEAIAAIPVCPWVGLHLFLIHCKIFQLIFSCYSVKKALEVLVQCVAGNIKLYSSYLKMVLKMVSLDSHVSVTSNEHLRFT